VLGGVGATVCAATNRRPVLTEAHRRRAPWLTIRRRSRTSAGKAFRQFARRPTGADRHALAALSRSSALRFEVRFDGHLGGPPWSWLGADDTLIRSPDELADRPAVSPGW